MIGRPLAPYFTPLLMTMFVINSKLRLTAALVIIHVTVGVQGFNVKLQI